MGKEPKVSALDRAIQQAMGEGRHLGLEADPARERYPALWEWLSRIYVGRDQIKQPATLTIRLGPEGCLVTLTDRDLCVSMDASCASLTTALDAMEAALQAPNPALRNWGKKEPQLRRRRSGG
jgi:hypothetical protein